MKSRYFLLAAAATALSSCETYNAMRMDTSQSPQASPETAELPEIAPATQIFPTLSPRLPLASKTLSTAPNTEHPRRDLGGFVRPGSLTIPTQAELQETATATEAPTGTPGLTVPARSF